MRAKLRHPFTSGEVYYGVGVHDFPEDTVLPSTAEEVDPAEVEADETGDAQGEKIPAKEPDPPEPSTLREKAEKSKPEKVEK